MAVIWSTIDTLTMMPLPASCTETGPLWYGWPGGPRSMPGMKDGELRRLLVDLLGELFVLLGQGGGLAGGLVDPLLDLAGQLPLLVLGGSQLLVLGLGLAAQLLGRTGGVLGGDALGREVVLGGPELVDHVLLAVGLGSAAGPPAAPRR